MAWTWMSARMYKFLYVHSGSAMDHNFPQRLGGLPEGVSKSRRPTTPGALFTGPASPIAR